MVNEYLLMHKNIAFGLASIDHEIGAMVNVEIMKPEYAPYLGRADSSDMRMWWIGRSIPSSRKEMIKRLERLGFSGPGDYLAKNLALSISDTYWICPVHMELDWDEINLFRTPAGGRENVSMHTARSYDSRASLGGEMDKYWDVSGAIPVLHKIARIAEGQQSVNECFATWIHSLLGAGVPYVNYWLEEGDETEGKVSCCKAFSSAELEFVSAKEIIPGNSKDDAYSEFIEICAGHGLEKDAVRRMMDYQTITDFIITNVDRHRGNFGILRDTNDLHFISPVPIFDSGNSMFFMDKERDGGCTREELEKTMINSLFYSESEMLECVVNRDVVDLTKLPDKIAVRDFYAERGINIKKAEYISANYEMKVKMLKQTFFE